MIVKRTEEDNKVLERFSDTFKRVIDKMNIDVPLNEYFYSEGYTFDEVEVIPEITEIKNTLNELKSENKKLRVFGDYDADGVCATAILYLALSSLGFDVDYRVPNRFKDGYGLSMDMVNEAIKDHVSCIITCDNGISAYKEIQHARENGMYVILTDHHMPKDDQEIPNADIILNPMCEESSIYGYRICGAELAYITIQKCFPAINEELLKDLSILAAIATITDVMPLTGYNRRLFKYASNRIKDNSILGLNILFDTLGITEFSPVSVGYKIGPVMNAAGRLEDASIVVDLLISSIPQEIHMLINRCIDLNEKRKEFTQKAVEKVTKVSTNQSVLVEVINDCNEGIVGIVAGKLSEKYNIPVILFTEVEDGIIKGSGRSTKSFNLFSAVNELKDMCISFGGHKQAIGLTIKLSDVDKFRKLINESYHKHYNKDDVKALSVKVTSKELTEKLVNELKVLDPVGLGSSIPLFELSNCKIRNPMRIGRKQDCFRWNTVDNDGDVRTVMFNNTESFENIYDKGLWLSKKGKYTVKGNINLNSYAGRTTLQLICKEII